MLQGTPSSKGQYVGKLWSICDCAKSTSSSSSSPSATPGPQFALDISQLFGGAIATSQLPGLQLPSIDLGLFASNPATDPITSLTNLILGPLAPLGNLILAPIKMLLTPRLPDLSLLKPLLPVGFDLTKFDLTKVPAGFDLTALAKLLPGLPAGFDFSKLGALLPQAPQLFDVSKLQALFPQLPTQTPQAIDFAQLASFVSTLPAPTKNNATGLPEFDFSKYTAQLQAILPALPGTGNGNSSQAVGLDLSQLPFHDIISAILTAPSNNSTASATAAADDYDPLAAFAAGH